jgi:hypothetical protein
MIVNLSIIVGAMLAMLAVYEGVRLYFPRAGTLAANGAAAFAFVVDYVAILPWGTVLPADKAALIGFAIAAANGIIRLRGPKLPILGG